MSYINSDYEKDVASILAIDLPTSRISIEAGLKYPIRILEVNSGDGCILNDCARGDFERRKIVIVKYLTVDIQSYDRKKDDFLRARTKDISMYYSSGGNSYEDLRKYFSEIEIEKENCNLWLPASGLGRDGTDMYKGGIKILKGYSRGGAKYEDITNYDLKKIGEINVVLPPSKTAGRFISLELLQLSYSMGGKFWKTYGKKIIKEYPLLNLQGCLQEDVYSIYVEGKVDCFVTIPEEECAVNTNKIIRDRIYSPYPDRTLDLTKFSDKTEKGVKLPIERGLALGRLYKFSSKKKPGRKKSRRKSCKYGRKKSGGCKKKPGPKKSGGCKKKPGPKKSRRKSSKYGRKKKPGRKKSRRKSCKYGRKKSGGCKKKPGPKKSRRKKSPSKSRRKSRSNVRIKITSPGSLTKYGYRMNKSAESRRRALRKAVRAYGYSKTMSKVNLLYIYNKNKNKSIARKASADKKWLIRTYK
jgi:hypothetical protein